MEKRLKALRGKISKLEDVNKKLKLKGYAIRDERSEVRAELDALDTERRSIEKLLRMPEKEREALRSVFVPEKTGSES